MLTSASNFVICSSPTSTSALDFLDSFSCVVFKLAWAQSSMLHVCSYLCFIGGNMSEESRTFSGGSCGLGARLGCVGTRGLGARLGCVGTHDVLDGLMSLGIWRLIGGRGKRTLIFLTHLLPKLDPSGHSSGFVVHGLCQVPSSVRIKIFSNAVKFLLPSLLCSLEMTQGEIERER